MKEYSVQEVRAINDQELLARIAQNASNSDVVRVVATANLEDQVVLGKIAQNDIYILVSSGMCYFKVKGSVRSQDSCLL